MIRVFVIIFDRYIIIIIGFFEYDNEKFYIFIIVVSSFWVFIMKWVLNWMFRLCGIIGIVWRDGGY